MSLVQDDDVVQALATDAPDEPLDIGVPPRTSWGDEHFFNPHMLHPLPKRRAIDPVPIAQRMAWRFFPRKHIHYLLSCPPRRRVFRDVEIPPAVARGPGSPGRTARCGSPSAR